MIGVTVLLSGVLRLFREQRAQTALARLAKLVHSTATVLRRPATMQSETQPRSIESRQLFVAQASLTSESLPVEKDAQRDGPPAAGVMLGLAALCNMNRYLRMAASSNFGNVRSVLVASAFLPFLPMLPIQLLVQNLLYDLSQAALPFDRVEPELVAVPRRWDPGEFKRFMLMSGPVSSLFDLLAFGVLAGVLQVATVECQALFQSA